MDSPSGLRWDCTQHEHSSSHTQRTAGASSRCPLAVPRLSFVKGEHLDGPRDTGRHHSPPAWVAVARAVWESGQPIAAVARHVRKHPQSVERYKSRDRWTRTVQAKRGPKGPRPWHGAAKAPYEAGELLEAIGARVGRSANTIGKRLASAGLIGEHLIERWTRLRNPSTHGDRAALADVREVAAGCDAVLSLLYQLTFICIGYRGLFQDTGGQAGWEFRNYSPPEVSPS